MSAAHRCLQKLGLGGIPGGARLGLSTCLQVSDHAAAQVSLGHSANQNAKRELYLGIDSVWDFETHLRGIVAPAVLCGEVRVVMGRARMNHSTHLIGMNLTQRLGWDKAWVGAGRVRAAAFGQMQGSGTKLLGNIMQMENKYLFDQHSKSFKINTFQPR